MSLFSIEPLFSSIQAALNKANAHAYLLLTGAGTSVAGASYSLTVTAKNANGTTNTTYTGRVTFTSTDPSAILPSDYTFLLADSGVKVFSVDFRTAQTSSVTATQTTNSLIKGTKSGIVVSPAALNHFIVSGFPDPYNVNQVQQNFTVTAYDAFNNIKTNYVGTVTFTSSDAKADLPSPYTFLLADAGTKSFGATLYTYGDQSITATDGAITASQSAITVQAYSTESFFGEGATEYGLVPAHPSLAFNWDDPWTWKARLKLDPVTWTVTGGGKNILDFVDDDGAWASAAVTPGVYTSFLALVQATATAMTAANPAITKFGSTSGLRAQLQSLGFVFSLLTNSGAHALPLDPQYIGNILGFNCAVDQLGQTASTGYTAQNDINLNNRRLTIGASTNPATFKGYAVTSFFDNTAQTGTFQTFVVDSFGGGNLIGIEMTDAVDFIAGFVDVISTYDGSGNASGLAYYVNGVAVSVDISFNNLIGNSTESGSDTWVSGVNGASNFTTGWINEPAVWNICLNPTQAAEASHKNVPINLNQLSTATNLIGYWRAENESGGITPNSSGVGSVTLTMTLQNGMTVDPVA